MGVRHGAGKSHDLPARATIVVALSIDSDVMFRRIVTFVTFVPLVLLVSLVPLVPLRHDYALDYSL